MRAWRDRIPLVGLGLSMAGFITALAALLIQQMRLSEMLRDHAVFLGLTFGLPIAYLVAFCVIFLSQDFGPSKSLKCEMDRLIRLKGCGAFARESSKRGKPGGRSYPLRPQQSQKQFHDHGPMSALDALVKSKRHGELARIRENSNQNIPTL